MANNKVEAVFKLPPEIVKMLKEAEPKIAGSEEALAALNKLGMNTKMIDDQVKWIREVNTTLLKTFS